MASGLTTSDRETIELSLDARPPPGHGCTNHLPLLFTLAQLQPKPPDVKWPACGKKEALVSCQTRACFLVCEKASGLTLLNRIPVFPHAQVQWNPERGTPRAPPVVRKRFSRSSGGVHVIRRQRGHRPIVSVAIDGNYSRGEMRELTSTGGVPEDLDVLTACCDPLSLRRGSPQNQHNGSRLLVPCDFLMKFHFGALALPPTDGVSSSPVGSHTGLDVEPVLGDMGHMA
ncbi:hypothetical protein DPEC_G00022950 [Dallia pectoralis]|uniref:Uncharacterized protein n=1 Tax=Dallia pectoralis TaxID=75939 RepID=A0ACC2HGL5_DALPE|nr:hypothetical protein DPEC_G00022950 [Dallia pectoralis]